MQDLSLDDLRPVAGHAELNLLRRGADGSLRISTDRWMLADVGDETVVFRSVTPDVDEQVLAVPIADVARLTWDRLPKQQNRSQLRFHLTSGDLWTFSGALSEPRA